MPLMGFITNSSVIASVAVQNSTSTNWNILVFRNNGAGRFTLLKNIVGPAGDEMTLTFFTDMDGDGLGDVAASTVSGRNSIMDVYRGSNNYGSAIRINIASTFTSFFSNAAVADLDGDSVSEIFLWYMTSFADSAPKGGLLKFTSANLSAWSFSDVLLSGVSDSRLLASRPYFIDW